MNEQESDALRALGAVAAGVAQRHVEAMETIAVAFENIACSLNRIAEAEEASNAQHREHDASQQKMYENVAGMIGNALARAMEGMSGPDSGPIPGSGSKRTKNPHLRPVPRPEPEQEPDVPAGE